MNLGFTVQSKDKALSTGQEVDVVAAKSSIRAAGVKTKAKSGFVFGPNKYRSSPDTAVNTIQSGKQTTDRVVCNDRNMGTTPKSGKWTIWQWHMARPGDKKKIGFVEQANVFKCTEDIKKPP